MIYFYRMSIGLFLCLVCLSLQAQAADTRWQIDLVAATEQVDLDVLHGNIQKAAELALPKLWQRLIPLSGQALLPKKLKAARFLQKAIPTANGVRVSFHHERVMRFLKKNHLPYFAEQPEFNVVVQLYHASGRPMGEKANALLDIAMIESVNHGYRLHDQGDVVVLLWRWLDDRQVNLTVRGNAKSGEFTETRQLGAGDPMVELSAWMMEVLLKARDAYAELAHPPVPDKSREPNENPLLGFVATPMAKPEAALHLRLLRAAGLADQVLFEQELQRDPRILSLSLRQVNADGQQYRLQLKDSDDLWLTEWFAKRGMLLTPTIEGWVAR